MNPHCFYQLPDRQPQGAAATAFWIVMLCVAVAMLAWVLKSITNGGGM